MSARYPFGTHRGSFPSTIEVITAPATNASGVSALRDVYGAVVLTGPAVSIPARVTRTRVEDMDTQPAVETNRAKFHTDGIKAFLPPIEEAQALGISSLIPRAWSTRSSRPFSRSITPAPSSTFRSRRSSDPGQAELGPGGGLP
jgi:hypothetical protein